MRPRPQQPTMSDFMAGIQGLNGGFNPYAAGEKRYGASGRDAPNIGPTSSPEGYRERDLVKRARRNYMLRMMKAKQRGRHMSPEALRTQVPGSYTT